MLARDKEVKFKLISEAKYVLRFIILRIIDIGF